MNPLLPRNDQVLTSPSLKGCCSLAAYRLCDQASHSWTNRAATGSACDGDDCGSTQILAVVVTDEELMRAVQSGDLSAFEQIVLRHQASAWNLACCVLSDRTEAEDVAQEAFLRVLDAAPRYQPTAKFRTYLLRIVSRLCLDRLRKKRPVYTDQLPDPPSSDPTPAGALLRQERSRLVRQALDRLSPQHRLVVILRYDEALSYEEIATVLQTSPKAVERLLARGRAALATLLSEPLGKESQS